MTEADLARAARRAKSLEAGPVTIEEVELARNVLRRRGNDVIGAIQVVGLCGRASDAPLLENFLQGEENNPYVEYGLKALCRYLGLVNDYRPLLRRWMREGDSARRMPAIHLAKEYFRDFDDQELGKYLVGVFCDIEDNCRRAVRDAFVDIFDIRAQLKDPFGLNFVDWDEDTTMILELAAAKFDSPSPLIVFGRTVH